MGSQDWETNVDKQERVEELRVREGDEHLSGNWGKRKTNLLAAKAASGLDLGFLWQPGF